MNHSVSATAAATDPVSAPSPVAAATAAVRTTRSTPSPPRPNRRSHSAATSSGVRFSRPAGSGRITKSLPVPWPLAYSTKRTRSSCPACGGHRARTDGELHRVVDQVGAGGVQPHQPVVAAEPRPLPADEPSGGADGLLVRPPFADPPVEVL